MASDDAAAPTPSPRLVFARKPAAIESGELEPLLALLSQEIEAGVTDRFSHVTAMGSAPEAPATPEDVPAARERVSEELAFIGYVEGIYQATEGGGHAEGAAVAAECGH